MRDSMRARSKDALQRASLAVLLFFMTYVGMALGNGRWPDSPITALLAALGICTALWVADPVLQHLMDDMEDRQEERDEAS